MSAPRRAFTLTELLIVIAILAVLMGLLFPAINLVRRNAAKAKTTAAINNVAAAVETYRTMNGIYPESWTIPAATAPRKALLDAALVALADAKNRESVGYQATDQAKTWLEGLSEGSNVYWHAWLTDPTDKRSKPKQVTATDPEPKAMLGLNALLTQQLITVDAGIAPRGLLLDAWNQPLIYRPNRFYPFEDAAANRIDKTDPPNPDGVQVWSIGYDAKPADSDDGPGESGDDLCNWAKLPR
jgi:prepilin-type N-terminal cleavage/methylation domain-containing protein